MPRSAAVRDIFLDALEIGPPERRAAFLDEACAGDARLRLRVEALIRAHERPESLLDRAAVAAPVDGEVAPGPPETAALPPMAECAGTTIGPYRLLEAIGEGGMGVVYLAEQTHPVRRRVALKVIKPGMDSRQVVARFEAERQALALMDHPNIARVHDAGMTPSGRPYFVMELIRGVPITEYCDQNRLSIPERLELFVLVCRAAQHAHQKGVIHRDLKPSNVLVTVVDGVAVPKVIDFGVAKATGGALTEKTLLTGFHQFVGTPLYVSPEQAELSGVDVDTRSDIYSLGVLLYELLTGTTPFDSETLKRVAFDEMRRIIREEEPPRPSTRLSSLGERISTVSARRKVDSRRLGPSLRGELDWVVMKALEKDRQRRYETAGDFAADVMRYLTDRPVEACPPSPWYRLAKCARRNRTPLAFAAVVSAVLVAGVATSIWQLVRATRAERSALAEMRAVVDYLVADVFGAAAPERAHGRALSIHQMLAEGERALPARSRGRPLAEAACREAMGRAYDALGRWDKAAEQFRRVVALRSRHLGPNHAETVAAESLLVGALRPQFLNHPEERALAEAAAIGRRVAEARRRTLGLEHPETLRAMAALAWALDGLGQGDEAFSLLSRAHEGQCRILGPEHPDSLATQDALGRVLFGAGDRAGAEAALRAAASGRRRVLGPGHPETLTSLDNLGIALQTWGRTAEAIPLLQEAAEGCRRTLGPTHLLSRTAFYDLTDSLRANGDAPAIRDVCEDWLEQILGTPPDGEPLERRSRSTTLSKLAFLLSTLPEPVPFDAGLAVRAAEEAVALDCEPAVRAVAARDASTGSWDEVRSVLGLIYYRSGRLDEARRAARASMDRPGHERDSALDWLVLALVHARRGDAERARSWYARVRGEGALRDVWGSDCLGPLLDEANALLGRAR